MAEQTQENAEGPVFEVVRTYIKDVSYTLAGNHELFALEAWNPHMQVDIETNATHLEESFYEVVLRVTIEAHESEQQGARKLFNCEVIQAGIFNVGQLDEPTRKQLLGAYGPHLLYNFLRETFASTISLGGFPQLNLAPINFDAMYQQKMEQEAADSADEFLKQQEAQQQTAQNEAN